MKTGAVYIKPLSPLPHSLHSNKIFGAICVGIRNVYGEKEVVGMLDEFRDNNPPFILSSMFPFVYDRDDENRKHHFFPEPITEPLELGGDEIERYYGDLKQYKKIKYLHQELFNELIVGKTDEKNLINRPDGGDVKIVNKDYLVRRETNMSDRDFSIKTQDTPHNVLNRLSNASDDFYYTKGVRFTNSGLFFLIRFFDDTYKENVASALRFIEDRGFGGDISSGHGQFRIDDDEVINEFNGIEEPKEGNGFTTLSLYSPKDELGLFDKDNMWYDLVNIHGKCSDGMMKKSIRMFVEGSTFPLLKDKKFYGKIADVRDNPEVVEYGYAFPIKMVR